jgi:hypothetical protein
MQASPEGDRKGGLGRRFCFRVALSQQRAAFSFPPDILP